MSKTIKSNKVKPTRTPKLYLLMHKRYKENHPDNVASSGEVFSACLSRLKYYLNINSCNINEGQLQLFTVVEGLFDTLKFFDGKVPGVGLHDILIHSLFNLDAINKKLSGYQFIVRNFLSKHKDNHPHKLLWELFICFKREATSLDDDILINLVEFFEILIDLTYDFNLDVKKSEDIYKIVYTVDFYTYYDDTSKSTHKQLLFTSQDRAILAFFGNCFAVIKHPEIANRILEDKVLCGTRGSLEFKNVDWNKYDYIIVDDSHFEKINSQIMFDSIDSQHTLVSREFYEIDKEQSTDGNCVVSNEFSKIELNYRIINTKNT